MRAALRRLTSGRWPTVWRLLSAAVIVAVGLTQISLDAVADALAGVSLPLAVLSWALLLAGQAISGVRWRVIAERLGATASTGWFVRAYLRGSFYNAFLPTGIGGDAMRVAVLRHEIGVKEAGRSVVYDRASGLLAICLTAGMCLPLTGYLDELPPVRAALAVAAVAAAVVVCAWLAHRRLVPLVTLTLAFMIVWFGGIYVLARALAIDVEPAAMPIVTLIVAIAIALPISVGGTGTREAGFVIALAPLGVGSEEAIALGICFGVVLALVGLVGAPLSVAQERARG